MDARNWNEKPEKIKTAEQYELEIWLLKKDLEFWRNSVNLNIVIKQNEKIKELEGKIKELAKQ